MAELARNRPTKPASKAYRLGWGELTSDKGMQSFACWIFLTVAGDMYPEMLADLQALRPAQDDDWCGMLEDWARRWRLTKEGNVPEWVTSAALCGLRAWARRPSWPWVWGLQPYD